MPDPAPLTNPQGEAIDQATGDVYVADAGNNRIEKFSPTGEFLLAFGKDVNPLASEPDICTAVEVAGGTECRPGTKGSAPGGFESPAFVAVDNDPSSPSFHDVYVGDTGDGAVSKFSSSGALEELWGSEGQLNGSTTPHGSFGELSGITVGSTGTLYVVGAPEPGFPAEFFEFEPGSGFLTELKTEEGIFPDGLAVNGEGDLFDVERANAGVEFSSAGTKLRFLTGFFQVGPLASGPDGSVYFAGLAGTIEHYAFNGAGEVMQPGNGTCAAECGPSDSTSVGFLGTGIAVGSDGTVDLSDSGEGKAGEGLVRQYGSAITVPDTVTGEASEVHPRTVRLNGTVNPAGLAVTECAFEYGETTSYDKTAPCAQSLAEINSTLSNNDTEPAAVSAEVTGLTPGATYHYRLVARNSNDPGPGAVPNPGADAQVETQPPPSVDSATVSSLTSESATLNAKINPHALPTAVHFEYDETPYLAGQTEHGTKTPTQTIEGTSDVAVAAPITGLHPATRYYWRAVASSEAGTPLLAGHSFVFLTGGETLPDNRAYELVSPSHKNGALLGVAGPGTVLPEVAGSGERVIAKSIQCFNGAPSCNAEQGKFVGSPYEFARTPEGWRTRSLAPSASDFPRNALVAYDAESGYSLFSMPTAPFNEDDLYVRAPGSDAFNDIGPTSPPADGELSPFGGSGVQPATPSQAFTADYSHVAWEAATRWTEPTLTPHSAEVFEYAGAYHTRPLLVGVVGKAASEALVSECGTRLPIAAGVMSSEGQTVFFEALPKSFSQACPGGALGPVSGSQLFARVEGETENAHTVALSDPSPTQCGGGPAPSEVSCRNAPAASARFVGASSDGSRAFFLSTRQLTDGASEDPVSSDSPSPETGGCSRTTGPNGCNLYAFEGVTSASPGAHHLVDVSEGEGPVVGGPRVQGVLDVSRDDAGQRIYFVAKGVLTSAERPGCTAEWAAAARASEAICRAANGAENLYVYDTDAHHVTFITRLSSQENEAVQWAPPSPTFPKSTNLTPDGRYLVFTSDGQLTPDDTSRSNAKQVFRWDAATGSLMRISLGSNGFNDDGNRSHVTCPENETRCPEQARLVIPQASSGRPDPTMADNGSRVFFESSVALTPGALDDSVIEEFDTGDGETVPVDVPNLYEWEAEGTGSCTGGHPRGCIFLIGDGKDVGLEQGYDGSEHCAFQADACLLGSDATGSNLFFQTDSRLSSADTNDEQDYYDARVCDPEHGNPCVAEAAAPPAPCAGEECHGSPVAVPGVPKGPSATFTGAGNTPPTTPHTPATKPPNKPGKLANALAQCRKKYKKRPRAKHGCEKRARAKYATKPKAAAKPANREGTR